MIQHGKLPDGWVFVVVYMYPIWPLVLLRSLRKYFTHDPIVIVNHMKSKILNEYYDDKCIILDGGVIRRHGSGVDIAVDYLKSNGYRYMVHVEPDCVITGPNWINSMISCIESGALMSGSSVLPFGPIHPCPSVWDLSSVDNTFDWTIRHQAIEDGIFSETKLKKWLAINNMPNNCQMGDKLVNFWIKYWDCGIQNWYKLAKLGHTMVSDGDGIIHFFNGRRRSPYQLHPDDYVLVNQYLY